MVVAELSDLEKVRELHDRMREEGNFNLPRPKYPHPYDSENYDAGEFEFINFDRSEVFGKFPQSTISVDPFSEINFECAEELITQYREKVSYPEWSVKIGNYPVPDFLNTYARNYSKFVPYSQLELACASCVLFYWGEVISLLDIRAYCISILEDKRCPFVELEKMHNRKVNNIIIYLRAISRRSGHDTYEIYQNLKKANENQ